MELISKRSAKKTVERHWDDEDFKAAMEYAAYIMALEELDAHGSEIERELNKALKKGSSKEVKKYHRAIIKAYVRTQDPRALELMEVVKHKPGGQEHEQKDHGKWAHDVGDDKGIQREKGESQDAWEERLSAYKEDKKMRGAFLSGPGVSGVGEDVFNFARLVAVPEKLAGGIAHASDHMADFLGSKSWGRKMKSGASFVFGKAGGSKVKQASDLAGQYGPATARSMMRGYYRYKGHDVPVDLDFKTGESREGARNRAITALSKRIPEDRAANELKSVDSFPPSEGYVINARGEIVARGVGKAKDDYMPFDFSHFKDMKGGSLVRRRVWGGPSKEDFHMAMLTGARDITTVSRNGTFTIELTDVARKNRGLHIDHPRIINRWEELKRAGKANNGPGVQAKLEALKAEYPLHFGDIQVSIAEGRDKEFERVEDREGGLLSAIFGGTSEREERSNRGRSDTPPSQRRANVVPPPDRGSGGSQLESPRFQRRVEGGEEARRAAEAGMGSSQRGWTRWGDLDPALQDAVRDFPGGEELNFEDDADMDLVNAQLERDLGFTITDLNP